MSLPAASHAHIMPNECSRSIVASIVRRSEWAQALAQATRTRSGTTAGRRETLVRTKASRSYHRNFSALVSKHLSNGDAEEALRTYRLALLAGSSVSPVADGAAVQALQNLDSSQWHSTRQVLRLAAAEKGIDVDTGYPIARLAARHSHQQHHPAWSVRIKEESLEERLHLSVERDLRTVHSAAVLWSPHRVAHLAMSYGLYRLQCTMSDGALRGCVLPWTLASMVHTLLTLGVAHGGQSSMLATAQERQSLAGNGLFRGCMHARLAELEHQLPRFDADTNILTHLCSVCGNVDELLLGRLAATLFQQLAVRRSSSGDEASIPAHLAPGQLTKVVAASAPTVPAIHGLHLRLEKIAERTMRRDVSQGVIVPDVDVIANQFDRLVSLSQHREVLVPFRVLLSLVMLASPDSNDWRKHRIRGQLRQLLRSLTTDAHLLADRESQRHAHGEALHAFSLGDNCGGVTVLGVLDELAILHTHVREVGTGLLGRQNHAASLHESIAWTAKHIAICRQNIAAGESRSERAAALKDPLSILLSGFGIRKNGQGRGGQHGGGGAKKTLGGTDVVVMSQSRAVHDACFAIGVPVMA